MIDAIVAWKRTDDHKDVDRYQHLYYGRCECDPESEKEQLMQSAADRASRDPTPDTPAALSGSWRVDPQASHARFVAATLAGAVKTSGRFGSLSGDLVADEAHATGALVIESASIDTGNRMRDRHLRSRDFFHVKRHPQLRYEARSISSQDPGSARIGGELVVAGTRTPLTLDVTLRAAPDGVVELACRTEVDRVELGIRGARAMVPRAVQVDVVITLRRAIA
jgi:polyisoprenoid-binding protein YceI